MPPGMYEHGDTTRNPTGNPCTRLSPAPCARGYAGHARVDVTGGDPGSRSAIPQGMNQHLITVSDHAVLRCMQRFPITRTWGYTACESWIAASAAQADIVLQRSNGDLFAWTHLDCEPVCIVAVADASHRAWLVRTVLTQAYAENQLNHRRRRSPCRQRLHQTA